MENKIQTQNLQTEQLLFWAIAVIAIARYFFLHTSAGLSFPVPWPDESSFLWQAISIMRDNTLFAPQLNPERHVMWMPPGYMIIQGFIFKLTGFSLPLARTLSALYISGAMLCFILILQGQRLKLLSVLLCGLFLTNNEFVFAGNFARMESLVLLTVFASLLLFHKNYLYPALSLTLLTPLIHPNGLYFCLSAAIFCSIKLWHQPEKRIPASIDMLFILSAAIIWAGYLFYIAQHWQFFVSDMSFQIDFKSALGHLKGGLAGRLKSTDSVVAIFIVAFSLAFWRTLSSPLLIVSAIPLLLMKWLSVGMTYGIYSQWLNLTLSLILIDLLANWGLRYSRLPLIQTKLLLATTVGAAIIGYHLHLGNIVSPLIPASDLKYQQMSPVANGSYISSTEIGKINEYLSTIKRSHEHLDVLMLPYADALLFHDLEDEQLRFTQDTFNEERRADIIIFHLSSLAPSNMIEMTKIIIGYHFGVSTPVDDWEVIYQHDGMGKWIVFDRSNSKKQAQH